MTLSYMKDNIGLALFDIGAFLDKTKSPEGKGFKFKFHEENPEAPLVPCYLNLRTPDNPKPGPLTPKVVRDIGLRLYGQSLQERLEYDCIAGVPRAGDPLAKAFSDVYYLRRNYRLPMLKLGKKELAEGRQIADVIDGSCQGTIVLLIDDLITKAGSKLEAIKVLEDAGLVVRDVLVLIDYEHDGIKELKERGYSLHSVFEFSELLDLYLVKQRISPSIYNEIKKYFAVDN